MNLSINRPRSALALELYSRAESSVGITYRSSSPNTGINPGGGRILKKSAHTLESSWQFALSIKNSEHKYGIFFVLLLPFSIQTNEAFIFNSIENHLSLAVV